MYHSQGNRARFSRGSRPQRNFSPRRYIAKPSHINPAWYVSEASQSEQLAAEVYQAKNAFADFGLSSQLESNVQRHGYTSPTPIQDQVIPILMGGQDVVGVANTGTGKTAAFLLPFIHKVMQDRNQGVLILAPTRELALQIMEEFRAFASNLPVSVCLCIGGASMSSQVQRLHQNPHFVIGTPGRVKDLVDRNILHTQMFTNVVLDEVDRMLDIGFRKDIQYLIDQLPAQRHAAFFSATLNRETEMIMKALLKNPVRITVQSQETHLQIQQDVIKLKPGENKIDVLHQLLQQAEFAKVIIFGRTKHGINKLEEQLSLRGVRVQAIHGNKTQGARQRSLQEFKRGRVQALLATDIVARGIDVENVTHVINFDEPQTYEDYIHRIGRTGRAGKMGKALTFLT